MPTTTRTLNPLPFLELEPHRFEDLVRQLAYDFRTWHVLEAVGRGGADDGQDIRGVETNIDDAETTDKREWYFQCKREKAFGPKDVKAAVAAALPPNKPMPYGFVVAAACDVSKKTRDVFREEMHSRGVEEFAIWARGELEDMLFRPNNDRLLFAYFGISLKTRRRSAETAVRGELARKRELQSLFDDEERSDGATVLLRDPSDTRYPRYEEDSKPQSQWVIARALHLKEHGHLTVVRSSHHACTTADGKGWDAIFDFNLEKLRVRSDYNAGPPWARELTEAGSENASAFWREHVDPADQARLSVIRFVPFERIIAVDKQGDGYYPIPHVLVHFLPGDGPFTKDIRLLLEGVEHRQVRLEPTPANRVEVFPRPLPDPGPSPGAFDSTSKACDLSNETSTSIEGLDAQVLPSEGEGSSNRERDEQADLQRLEFSNWCESVARPVMSAFVNALRAKGHRARVVRRSDATSESVQLRVSLSSDGGPGRVSWHHRFIVLISWSTYRGWTLIETPRRDESRATDNYSRRPPADPPPYRARADLERVIAATLQRSGW